MVNIYYNPKLLLQAAGFYWIWNLTFSIILIGLMISFVAEVFKLQKRAQPDFWGVVWKGIIIILLYRYLPSTIGGVVGYLNGMSGTAELDKSFYNVFSILSNNLNQVEVDRSKLPTGCVMEDVSFWNYYSSALMADLWNFLARLLLFVVVVLTWLVKEVMFTWAWPTLMSINMLGLCAALVMPAFPNQGFGSIGSFIKSVVTLMLWPVIYTVFMMIIGKALQASFADLQKTLACPSSYEFGRTTVVCLAGSVFMAYGIKAIPEMAKAVMEHRGMGRVAGGTALAAGALATKAGGYFMNSSSSVSKGVGSGLNKAGAGLAKAGVALGGKIKDAFSPSKPGGGDYKPPTPKGGMLQGGGKGYSMNQAQELLSQVRSQDPEKAQQLGKKLRQGANINTGRGTNADKSAQNNAIDSVAKDAINFLGGDKEK